MVINTREFPAQRPVQSSLKRSSTLIHPGLRPISPALRHWIMGRDGFQCRAPGCNRSEGLSVEQIEPGTPGGRNNPANLVTVCSGCLPFWDIMGRGPFLEVRSEPGSLAIGL